MGSCIICGSSVEGRICELHEEDVVFEFRGNSPDELTPNRYYRGSVDGYAEFGVFVDIGDSVTGLLHRSELDQRLDSLEWEPGDTVFVKVKDVRDNGNVDLGWSIRQEETAFRGTLVDDPDGEMERVDTSTPEEEETEAAESASTGSSATTDPTGADAERGSGADEPTPEHAGDGGNEPVTSGGAGSAVQSAAGQPSRPDPEPEPIAMTVDELPDHVGDTVRLEGEIVDARQTSGPTVFTLRDETGTVECAAFEAAGVRAYPEVDEDEIVRLEGEVERRRGDLQVETEALVVLGDDERSAVTDRMEEAMVKRARPETVEPLAADEAVERTVEELRDVATAVRRAVIEGRPVVVRHGTTADGYLAGVALERATLPRIREEHQAADAEYHYFDRRPLEGSIYDLEDATKDVTTMLSNRERHDEALPLFVFLGVGGSAASVDAFELLEVYDARRVLVDDRPVDPDVRAIVDTVATPHDAAATPGPPAGDGVTTATALATAAAAAIAPETREELAHLPAVSFWEDPPAGYADLAAEAGFDAETRRDLRQAVTLEAFYQSYEDKRELVADLLFPGDAAAGLASKVAEQCRTKLAAAVETAEANLEEVRLDGEPVLVLDADAYTHRYEFPPVELLLDELWRRHRDAAAALVGLNTDEGYLRTDHGVDVDSLGERAAEAAPSAGIAVVSPRDGTVEYLVGERERAREALLAALDEQL